MESPYERQFAEQLERQAEALRRHLRRGRADDRIRDHVRVLAGPQPYRHNHHSEGFYRHDPARGTVENLYGQRVLRVGVDFLTALAAGLGTESDEVQYECGRLWGGDDFKAFAARARQEWEVEFEQLGMGMMLESWWAPWAAAGWGRFRYDFRAAPRGVIAVELWDSAVVAGRGGAGRAVCALPAGVFAALFSDLARRELACVEIECAAAAGAECCRFVASTPGRVDVARLWRDGGAGRAEIVARLEAAS